MLDNVTLNIGGKERMVRSTTRNTQRRSRTHNHSPSWPWSYGVGRREEEVSEINPIRRVVLPSISSKQTYGKNTLFIRLLRILWGERRCKVPLRLCHVWGLMWLNMYSVH